MDPAWERTERQIRQVVESLDQRLTPEEQHEVFHFLAVSEYAVAFDTLTGILHDRGIEPTSEERRQLDALAIDLDHERHWRDQR